MAFFFRDFLNYMMHLAVEGSTNLLLGLVTEELSLSSYHSRKLSAVSEWLKPNSKWM